MFSAFNTFGKLGAIGKAIAAAWSPLSLWPDGINSPGMWISPRTLTSEWQDYTGTTAVAVPGTVADTSNPVGLALDIRAGATVLTDPGNHMLQSTSAARPLTSARVNLLTYTEDFAGAGWSDIGGGTTTATYGGLAPDGTSTAWSIVYSQANMDIRNSVPIPLSGCCRHIWIKGTSGETLSGNFFASDISTAFTGDWQKFEYAGTSGQAYAWIGTWDGATARTVSLWHPQVEYGTTATPYQAILTDGSSYSSTGFPIAQLYDGVDDGMATAAFTAGTLTSAMDCMIPVRRDSGANCVVGLYQELGIAFGEISGAGVVSNEASGSPTVWVDGVQLEGGTSVTQATMNAAVTVGDWHIVEWRGLNLSAWTRVGFGGFGYGYNFPGARGDIMLYPSTTPTEDKDAARQWLADYYGVTLP